MKEDEFMIEWIIQNMATIIVSIVMLAAFILAIRYIYKSKKAGKACIGCGGCNGKCDRCN